MEECPICYNENNLVVLDGCILQKHRVCKECFNRSKGTCWFCGDRISDMIMERMEEGRLRPSQTYQEPQVYPLEQDITIPDYDDESCVAIIKRMIDGICILTPLVCMTIVVGKIIETIFCNLGRSDECNISNLSINTGYYLSGFCMTLLIWLYLLVKFDDCRRR